MHTQAGHDGFDDAYQHRRGEDDGQRGEHLRQGGEIGHDQPGKELIVGFQVSDQVLRSVAVFTFRGGRAELLLMELMEQWEAAQE